MSETVKKELALNILQNFKLGFNFRKECQYYEDELKVLQNFSMC